MPRMLMTTFALLLECTNVVAKTSPACDEKNKQQINLSLSKLKTFKWKKGDRLPQYYCNEHYKIKVYSPTRWYQIRGQKIQVDQNDIIIQIN